MSGLVSLSSTSNTTKSTRILSSNNLGANFYPQDLYTTLDHMEGIIIASLSFVLIASLVGSYSGKLIAT